MAVGVLCITKLNPSFRSAKTEPSVSETFRPDPGPTLQPAFGPPGCPPFERLEWGNKREGLPTEVPTPHLDVSRSSVPRLGLDQETSEPAISGRPEAKRKTTVLIAAVLNLKRRV